MFSFLQLAYLCLFELDNDICLYEIGWQTARYLSNAIITVRNTEEQKHMLLRG